MSQDNAPEAQKKPTIWYTDALRAEVKTWPQTVKYVLHVITKKMMQKTSKPDIDTAKKRYKALIEARKQRP